MNTQVIAAMNKSQTRIPIMLTEKEEKFIKYCRELGFGRFEVWIKEGQPVRAEVPKQSIEF